MSSCSICYKEEKNLSILRGRRNVLMSTQIGYAGLIQDTGAIGKQIKDGIRLMGRGADQIHLEVSRLTVRAKQAVEAAGGSVRRVHYNKLGFRALLKPEWFEKKGRLLPKASGQFLLSFVRPPKALKGIVSTIEVFICSCRKSTALERIPTALLF